MPTINFPQLTDAQKMQIADLVQRLEAIDAGLAAVQTQRANAEIQFKDRENFLKAERMKVQAALRQIRQAEISE